MNLDERRLALNEQRMQLDIQRFQQEQSDESSEAMQAQTDRIDSLMGIVMYLNRRQDGEETFFEQGHETQRTTVKAQSLNPHEEDLLNASLIQLKKLVGFVLTKKE